MIKINLLAQPKKFKIPVVMGLDIRMFNFKMLFVVFLLSYIPDLIHKFYFDIEKKAIDNKIVFHRGQIAKYNKVLKKNRALKLKVEAFEKQAGKLKQREQQVIAIIKQRTNPFKVLTKLAQIIPEKAWLEKINIKEKQILLSGYAANYKSIGDFIDSLNGTIFFNKSIRLKKTESVKQKFNRQEFRIEKFSLQGTIERFD